MATPQERKNAAQYQNHHRPHFMGFFAALSEHPQVIAGSKWIARHPRVHPRKAPIFLQPLRTYGNLFPSLILFYNAIVFSVQKHTPTYFENGLRHPPP